MPTDLERLEVVLCQARNSLGDAIAAYRKVIDAHDVMVLLLRKMKKAEAQRKSKEAEDGSSC